MTPKRSPAKNSVLSAARVACSRSLEGRRPLRRRWMGPVLAIGMVLVSPWSHALDLGPFSLTGFMKVETVRASNQCSACQRFPEENKQRLWADQLVAGAPYGAATNAVVLFQPWLGAKFDLGGGYRAEGLLSQRWRDGQIDIAGALYEANAAISHEDRGRIAYGAMTSRAWSLADYPFGSDIGLADFWGSSGAGYGLNTRALRYTSRLFDVSEGDLALEITWDRGDTRFQLNKPRFIEFYAQYRKGGFGLDAVFQDARNGNPQAWSHGPFKGLTANPADDAKLGSSSQGVVLLMATYRVDARLSGYVGLRRNRWSGARAVFLGKDPATGSDLWNSMFNVDWNGTLNGVANPGYAATSTDAVLGTRWKQGPWSLSAGLGWLGRAKTDNPSERGQGNSALMGALGAGYDFGRGFQGYALAGAVRYGRLGLSPMSMPGNAAFSGVDSRVTRTGNWFGAGAVYTF